MTHGIGWDGLIIARGSPWLLRLRQISLTVFLGFGTAAAVPKNILIKTKRLLMAQFGLQSELTKRIGPRARDVFFHQLESTKLKALPWPLLVLILAHLACKRLNLPKCLFNRPLSSAQSLVALIILLLFSSAQ